MSSTANYEGWSREKLIERIAFLENQGVSEHSSSSSSSVAFPLPLLVPTTTTTPPSLPQKPSPQSKSIPIPTTTPPPKQFTFNTHPLRKIALKFCYSGWQYNGLAYQQLPTPLPTVEGVLLDALVKARLVDGDGGGGVDGEKLKGNVKEMLKLNGNVKGFDDGDDAVGNVKRLKKRFDGDDEDGDDPSEKLNGFEKCGWEKCGRTDKGVSAAGQVVSLWVRSALPQPMLMPMKKEKEKEVGEGSGNGSKEKEEDGVDELVDGFGSLDIDIDSTPHLPKPSASSPLPLPSPPKPPPSNPKHEFDYPSILNRLLPPTIRILSWSPVSPNFSARFNCTHRHYKYFFSGFGLDIGKMREGAGRLVGEHDFRNLCKLDVGKQIKVFKRRVLRAEIGFVGGAGDGGVGAGVRSNGGGEGVYVFDLVGSAFLYHQVRHIMAILFLIGSGLEPPSVISSLLNVSEGAEVVREGDRGDDGKGNDMEGVRDRDDKVYEYGYGEGGYEVVDSKPDYQMADALPLMLWECGYPDGEVKWRMTGEMEDGDDGKDDEGDERESDKAPGSSELYHQLQSIHSQSQIYMTLNHHFLKAAALHHPPPNSPFPLSHPNELDEKSSTMMKKKNGRDGEVMNIPLGGGTFKRSVRYTRLLRRKRLDSVEVANERWRLGKGFKREERDRERKRGLVGA